MPTPKDHRDITVVINPPPATSTKVAYHLAYIGNTDGKIFEALAVDTNSTDATYRELNVLSNGNLVLSIRAYFSVRVAVGPGQTAHKLVNRDDKPSPPIASQAPGLPPAHADQHRWVGEGHEVELTLDAKTDQGSAYVVLYRQTTEKWGIVIVRASDNMPVASGFVTLPAGAVKR
ncbi:MAG: hypothetical protein AAGF11_13080 [Myxococcota bacterium]